MNVVGTGLRTGGAPFSAIVAVLVLFAACASPGTFRVPPPVPDDRNDIPPPDYRKIYEVADGFDKQVAKTAERRFDLSRWIRWIAGKPKQALNVNAFDEVPNSSWFTNRNGREPMSLEAIRRGPNRGNGPDPTGAWTIVRAKTEGVTPGFTVEDRHGDRYVIKFDPQGFAELATAAEVISTKFFHAAGYNVPENYLVAFNDTIFRLGEGVMIIDEYGDERTMTDADLRELLDGVERRPDGSMRAVASKHLEGKILGPFRYHGQRKDDPNDFVPHEHRRELRGMSIIAAWLNHYDTKAANSLDVYVEENGKRFVRHYLIDFGSTLGSQGNEPMPEWVGFENTFDMSQVFTNVVTLGFYVPSWEVGRRIKYRSIGLFDNKDFQPDDFKTVTPNPAFVNRTDRDALWGAKIVASFSDAQIRSVVETGRYSDPEAEAYLIDVLIERRDMIAAHWFNRVNALDRFEVVHDDSDAALGFVDPAVRSGVAKPSPERYEYELRRGGEPQEAARTLGGPPIPLPAAGGGILEVRVRHQFETGKWSEWLSVFLDASANPGGYRLLALSREN